MTNHERVIYSVNHEDIECLAPEFHKWLSKQGDAAMENAINEFADNLIDYFDYGSDGIYDCLRSAMKSLGFDEDDEEESEED